MADLAEYLRAFQAGGHPVLLVRDVTCPGCGGGAFDVQVDSEDQCAVATCRMCATVTPLADSADYLRDAELGDCACPCGGEEFAVALGFAMRADGAEVRWVSVGLRCLADGAVGVYADWKIDYSPSAHLVG